MEKIIGVIERVTYHDESSGWSVLKVRQVRDLSSLTTVTVHQTKVFAGATMEFKGKWSHHPKYGKQFTAQNAVELQPADSAAIEKYLGSGLIKGIGPKTAKKIVQYFGQATLDIFEKRIEDLTAVPGIAHKKLETIKTAWREHREIREVMMFLQSFGISTLFAVRIYKYYGDSAISVVRDNPYRLATDFYGIGFFTADKIALLLGYQKDSIIRIMAGIRHVLSASRESGHCYLTTPQVISRVNTLLDIDTSDQVQSFLISMEQEDQLRSRKLPVDEGSVDCYYAKSIYYDEEYVAKRISSIKGENQLDRTKIEKWVQTFSKNNRIKLSNEQHKAVIEIVNRRCSILTGGPGCGKTTTTKIIAQLLEAMSFTVTLTAPTGRAAQRMGEVIGLKAKTIHRLLEFHGNGFKKNEENPLKTDFLIIDECSMLDISLAASLLRAVQENTSVLLIGDADQLPSVGAGNVLKDLIASTTLPCYTLKTIFRQAKKSAIIAAAHAINQGNTPRLDSPFKKPDVWQTTDCFFIDSDEATKKQISFARKVRQTYTDIQQREELFAHPLFHESESKSGQQLLSIPEEFNHVSLAKLAKAETAVDQLLLLVKKTHPWSSLYYGLSALDVVIKLYTEWVPKYYGSTTEIQVLSPMLRGSLGTFNLNQLLQENVNPKQPEKAEIQIGEKLFRTGDRVIHRRNNYDLNVFNGDIGRIRSIDNINLSLTVFFPTDNRLVEYNRDQVIELELAYGITIHKSQGSEFDVVIIPVLSQHFTMLFRNLLYTGITRGKKLAVLVGTRKALAMAVNNVDTSKRQTALCHILQQMS